MRPIASTLFASTFSLIAALAGGAAAETAFDNTTNWTGSNAILSGAEWADDLHLTKAGDMTGFSFGFISNGSTSATVRFYANDATNSILPVAGNEFHTEVVAIPGGGASGLKVVALGAAVAVPEHLWMSIQFNGSSGAMPLYTPATVGWSDPQMVIHVPSGWGGSVFGTNLNSFRFAVEIDAGGWTDLGHALAGTSGAPVLQASGTLAAGAPFSFDLSNARPNALTALVAGTSAWNAPFKGGTLVPAAENIVIAATDGAGNLAIGGTTPAGIPGGTALFVHYWISDPAGPVGMAASNAMSATSP